MRWEQLVRLERRIGAVDDESPGAGCIVSLGLAPKAGAWEDAEAIPRAYLRRCLTGCESPPATRLHGMREGRMGRPAPRHPAPIVVRAAYEPTRVADEALRGAYRVLIATPARKTVGPSAPPERETLRRAEGSER
jgi:hypothetical protein